MKKISILIILALALTLTACTAKKADEEEPTVDNGVEEAQNNSEAEEDPEAPEMPWIGEPIETPILPLSPVDSTQPDEEETPDGESKEPAVNKDFYDGIAPDENELPPIPLD